MTQIEATLAPGTAAESYIFFKSKEGSNLQMANLEIEKVLMLDNRSTTRIVVSYNGDEIGQFVGHDDGLEQLANRTREKDQLPSDRNNIPNKFVVSYKNSGSKDKLRCSI